MSEFFENTGLLNGNLRHHIKQKLAANSSQLEVGDHTFNDGKCSFAGKFKSAAVLILIVERSFGPSIVLTHRHSNLSAHAGQIALPGGRIDKGDANQVATALRETEEEIGVNQQEVEILGKLPIYRTGSGYLISPVVGITHESVNFIANPAEVTSIFEVPLKFIMDEANHEPRQVTFSGIVRNVYAMPYKEHDIWGITAGILKIFYQRMVKQ